ncbi:MAG: 5-(carboxyamino)imidazole ribonucleotide synthase [Gammaproteobacteria bacterium]|nr:5-(carboxyamino)imidazole ribonucleotide synthase [Gammaproteobacteria bacterium]NNJ51401.1 5-(carboxyamino)imidazole ribonucleotide synthase [Gammaproteobacteria bacterium]
MTAKQILPGATLGVLGGGQLGRMFCVAARTMGYRVVVLDPDPHCGAGHIADMHICADYTDQYALQEMAGQCDAITLEFENIPSESVRFIADKTTVYPVAESLEIAQNRDLEKQFAQKAGLQPAPYLAIQQESDLRKAADKVGFPAILKSNTMGYDGKGQYVVNNYSELGDAYADVGKVDCVLEKKIDIRCEISAIVARNAAAEMASFPVSENQHRNGILHMSIVPARVSDEITQLAIENASLLADAMSYVGILAVEFFVSDDDTLYFNEMAPRPHNSGHYTRDACVTSQFEQQVRMMCGLKPGDTRLMSPVVMVNMLGDLWLPDWLIIFTRNNVKLHLYGKTEARPGRKMGHFNVLAEDVGSALIEAESVFNALSGD